MSAYAVVFKNMGCKIFELLTPNFRQKHKKLKSAFSCIKGNDQMIKIYKTSLSQYPGGIREILMSKKVRDFNPNINQR